MTLRSHEKKRKVGGKVNSGMERDRKEEMKAILGQKGEKRERERETGIR